MTRAPHPTVLAQALTATATTARTDGDRARRMATLLAARGYPNGTLGTRTTTTTTTTSVERAVGLVGDDGSLTPPEGQWVGIDAEITKYERLALYAALRLGELYARVLAHASDDDPIPAGRGNCQRCDTFCKGDGGNDRLRGGLCHNCTSAWRRWREQNPASTRSDFIRATRNETAA